MAKKRQFDFSDLSPAERIQLAQDLWDSVDAAAGIDVLPLTDAQRAELEDRLADPDANPEDGSSWEDVRARVQNTLQNENRHRRGA